MAPLVFIVGCGRTGTHWLARSLVQSGFTSSMEDHLALVDRAVVYEQAKDLRVWQQLVDTYREERRQVDKSHPLLWCVERLAKAFPHARFLAIKRGEQATVASMLRHPGVRSWCQAFDRKRLPIPNKSLGIRSHAQYTQLSLGERCALRWRTCMQEIDRLEKVMPKQRWLTVHYETLEKEARKIQHFLGRTRSIQIETRRPRH